MGGKRPLAMYILVPVLCILSFILLLVCVWLFCLKAKKPQSFYQKKKKHGQRIVPPDFMIPCKYKTVEEQLPASSYEKDGSSAFADKFPGANMGRRGAAGIQNELKEWNQSAIPKRSSQLGLNSSSDTDLCSTAGSFSSTEMDSIQWPTFEVERQNIRSTAAKDRRRRISLAMIQTFREEGRRVSVPKSTGIYDGGENSEALAAALEAAEFDSAPRIESVASQSESEDNSQAINTADSEPLFVRKRMAARRGKDRKRFAKTGQLCFTIQYFPDKKKLEVTIKRAFDLGKNLDRDQMNPFLRLYLLPGKKQKQHTRVKRKTKDPFFNERRAFYNLSEKDLVSHRLKFKVYNREAMTVNGLLGETDITLSSLIPNEKQSFTVDLMLTKEQVNTQLLISLCHNAANSQLDVTVHRARRLPSISRIGAPATYCRLCLFQEDRCVRLETKVKRDTSSPIWGEKLTFNVSTSSSDPLHVQSLAVTLINHIVIGKDKVIGHVMFSLDSSQASAVHDWQQVNDCPHESFTNWHTLTEPEDI